MDEPGSERYGHHRSDGHHEPDRDTENAAGQVQAIGDPGESIGLLAPLLSLPATERAGAIELTIEQRAEHIFRVLLDQLRALAVKGPVLYVLEDAHWIDPTTRELVTQTLGRIGDARVLMLITHRPDFQSEWAHHPQVTALSLGRLSPGQGAEVARAAGGEALPEEAVARILRRADGVPLYIEEMTRSVVETGNVVSDVEIPETLQASLLARLDRLGPEAKELAQLAAVLGREFKAELLNAAARQPRELVGPALQRLVASQIVLPAGLAADGVYAFRHALIQDAAYQSLLLARRRQHHQNIAQALETQFPNTAESQPEIIAQHYTAAAEPERAIPYWLRAGNRALARYAVLESIVQFERGLQLARQLPEGIGRSRQIMDLLLPLGSALSRTTRRNDALTAFKEAAELARKLGSAKDLTRAALGADTAEFWIFSRDHQAMGLLETALVALGEEESVDRCRVLSRLGRALFGSMSERARKLLDEAVNLARRVGDPQALWDALVCADATTAGYPWSASQFPERRRALDEMLAVAEEIGDPELIAEAEGRRLPVFLEMADLDAFESSLAHKHEVEEEHELTGFAGILRSTRAMEAILHGDFAEAERLAASALDMPGGVHTDVAAGIYGVQMFTIRRAQGRLAEVAPLLRRFLEENPEDAAWRPGLALIASDLGFADASRKAFEGLAASGFAFPIDAKRNLTLSYLAEVCARLGDADRAAQLYELLSPYRDLAVVVPVSTVCCGANSRYLGMLATVTGDWATAEEYFEAALGMDERLHAWPWLAHTKHEFALALLARGRSGDLGPSGDLAR